MKQIVRKLKCSTTVCFHYAAVERLSRNKTYLLLEDTEVTFAAHSPLQIYFSGCQVDDGWPPDTADSSGTPEPQASATAGSGSTARDADNKPSKPKTDDEEVYEKYQGILVNVPAHKMDDEDNLLFYMDNVSEPISVLKVRIPNPAINRAIVTFKPPADGSEFGELTNLLAVEPSFLSF